jgi:hypothetical protein
MLDIELKFFCDHLPEWLEKHTDRVALVKGAELIGFFDDEQQAIATGARQFGLGPFLVRRVQTEEPPVSAPALTLGILRASNIPPIADSRGRT